MNTTRTTGAAVAVEPLLRKVTKPGRYVGGEWNSVVKDWEAMTVRIALAYPDIYDIGMSNLGLGILYDLLNRHENYVAEQARARRRGGEAAAGWRRQPGPPPTSPAHHRCG